MELSNETIRSATFLLEEMGVDTNNQEVVNGFLESVAEVRLIRSRLANEEGGEDFFDEVED